MEGAVRCDHIYISVRILPKYAVSEIIGYVKGKRAMTLYERHPEWRRWTGWSRAFWARGYYVSTVGLNEEVVKKYIQNQEESDQLGTDN